MSQQSSFLSSAVLKDRAKGRLEGNYLKLFCVTLVVAAITFVFSFLTSFVETLLFLLYFIVKGGMGGLSADQLQLLLSEGNIQQLSPMAFAVIQYTLVQIVSVFTTVMQIGICLCYLNIACGRQMKISDVFYGFRNQFGKSIKLCIVLVLLGQLYYLPQQFMNYLIQTKAEWRYVLFALLAYTAGVLIYVIVHLSISQTVLLFLDFPGYSVGELFRLSIHIMKGHKARLFYIQLSFLPLLFLSLLTLFIGNLWLTPYMNMTYVLFFLNLMQAREKSC